MIFNSQVQSASPGRSLWDGTSVWSPDTAPWRCSNPLVISDRGNSKVLTFTSYFHLSSGANQGLFLVQRFLLWLGFSIAGHLSHHIAIVVPSSLLSGQCRPCCLLLHSSSLINLVCWLAVFTKTPGYFWRNFITFSGNTNVLQRWIFLILWMCLSFIINRAALTAFISSCCCPRVVI